MADPFFYLLGGLRVASDLVLPGLPGADPHLGWDVRIVRDRALESADEYSYGVSTGSGFQLSVPGIARFLIDSGREIRIQSVADGTEDALRPWLLGSVVGALMHLRGALPLHASAVSLGDEIAAFAGPCGAGKSTLCAFLAQRGYAVTSDDVLVLWQDRSGLMRVAPGSASLRLKADTLRACQTWLGPPDGVTMEGDKSRLNLPITAVDPLPLRSLYLLDDQPVAGSCAVFEATGTDALKILIDNVYRPQYAHLLDGFGRAFALAAAAARQTRIYRLRRPRGLHRMPEVLDTLESHWYGLRTDEPCACAA